MDKAEERLATRYANVDERTALVDALIGLVDLAPRLREGMRKSEHLSIFDGAVIDGLAALIKSGNYLERYKNQRFDVFQDHARRD